MKIYIAGPITGVLDYRNNFKQAETELIEKGHIIINPATLPDGLGTMDDYLHICFAMIDKCDAVYFLLGWEKSKGANKEYEYAEYKSKRMYYQLE